MAKLTRNLRNPAEEQKNFFLIDDWLSLEECNHMIWAHEYDGSAVLWKEMRKNNHHFPRKMSDWLVDSTARAGSYLYMIRDRVTEEVVKHYDLPYMFNADSYTNAVVNSKQPGDVGNWWEHYTAILFLNENYRGGSPMFHKRNLFLRPRMGSLLLFPSSERWELELVQGNAYHVIYKFTDFAAHREDDHAHTKNPFGVKLEATTTTTTSNPPPLSPPPPPKKKGCSKCVNGKQLIKVTDNKTGKVKDIWRDTKEVGAMAQAKKSAKKIII